MRRPSQYFFAGIIGGFVGGSIAQSETLLGAMIGAGVGMLAVFFVHIYPHVGYAEQKLDSPHDDNRKLKS